jgi:hypothetical protein
MNKIIALFFIATTLISSNSFCMFLILKRFSPWQSPQGSRFFCTQKILSPQSYVKLCKQLRENKKLLDLLKQDDSSSDLRARWKLEAKIKEKRKAIKKYNINKQFSDNK